MSKETIEEIKNKTKFLTMNYDDDDDESDIAPASVDTQDNSSVPGPLSKEKTKKSTPNLIVQKKKSKPPTKQKRSSSESSEEEK